MIKMQIIPRVPVSMRMRTVYFCTFVLFMSFRARIQYISLRAESAFFEWAEREREKKGL